MHFIGGWFQFFQSKFSYLNSSEFNTNQGMYDYFTKKSVIRTTTSTSFLCNATHKYSYIHENVQTSPVYLLLLYLFVCKFVGQSKTFMAFMCGEG